MKAVILLSTSNSAVHCHSDNIDLCAVLPLYLTADLTMCETVQADKRICSCRLYMVQAELDVHMHCMS